MRRLVGYPSVSVGVLALTEERNILHVFDRFPEHVHQVMLVDGCSVDATVAIARRLRPDVRVVSQTGTLLRYRASWHLLWTARILPRGGSCQAAGSLISRARATPVFGVDIVLQRLLQAPLL